MPFKNIQFPPEFCIAYQSSMGEQFSTRVTAPGGNAAEGRTSSWGENSRHTFNPVTNIIGMEDLARLQAFHNVVQGRAYAFRIEWPGDNVAENSTIDTSAGGTSFQLRKQYRVPTYSYDGSATTYETAFKPIYLCVPQTCFLTLNGVDLPVAQNPAYAPLWNGEIFNPLGENSASISNSGVITLSSSITSSDVLQATFNYHYIVRFVNDELGIQLVNHGAYSVNAPMIEVYGEDVN